MDVMNDFTEQTNQHAKKIQWDRVTWYSQLAAVVLGVLILLFGMYLGQLLQKQAHYAEKEKESWALPKEQTEKLEFESGFDSDLLRSCSEAVSNKSWLSLEEVRVLMKIALNEAAKQQRDLPHDLNNLYLDENDVPHSMYLLSYNDNFAYFCTGKGEAAFAACEIVIYDRVDDSWSETDYPYAANDYYLDTDEVFDNEYLAIISPPNTVAVIDLSTSKIIHEEVVHGAEALGYPSDGLPDWVTNGEWMDESVFEVAAYRTADTYELGIEVPVDTFEVTIP